MAAEQVPEALDFATLTGRSAEHVRTPTAGGPHLYVDVLEPFRVMQAAARADGIDLHPVSPFRSFATQVRIWNEKFSGQRAVLADDGSVIDVSRLSPEDVMWKILRWSAVPGASRHHWGTDFDVIDRAALPPGGRVELTASEYEAGGVFARANSWLDRRLEEFGFFRPYDRDRGGVAVEPWHLSHAATAERFEQAYTSEIFIENLRGQEFAHAALVERHAREIYVRFFNIRAE